ncbi:hypothetical protein [Chryseobacterium foetidum]|uniref:hypothetical protein n=1 Tax=Chryseobacterium foetidum TaxID=2951057 RepID=UPI0021C84640|nr:hypothetical protein [Chryseobacterium foetidum]
MDNHYLEIKNYINAISLDQPQEYYEYDHFPFIVKFLDTLTPKQQDDFVEEVFTWDDHELHFVADCLNFTEYELQGKYESSYVFCECFAKIDNAEYLEYLYHDLAIQVMQRKFFKNGLVLSIDGIVNNLYLLMNSLRDESSINYCLKIIAELEE